MPLSWILSILGVAGAGGLIALYIFAPAVAILLLTVVRNVLGALLKTRLGCAALALLVGLAIGFVKGEQSATAKCDAANLRAKIASLERDKNIQKAAAEEATAALAEIAQQKSDLDGKVSSYEAELAKRDDNSCRLSPADIERLRAIR
jgi:hypothetical protein